MNELCSEFDLLPRRSGQGRETKERVRLERSQECGNHFILQEEGGGAYDCLRRLSRRGNSIN